MNLHVTNLYGENAHHIVESVSRPSATPCASRVAQRRRVGRLVYEGVL